MYSIDETVNSIRNTSLFFEMSEDELQIVASFLTCKQYKKDSIVFKKNDAGNEMFIVKSGLLASFLVDCEGNRRLLGQYKLGDFFGEMAIIENQSRSAECDALSDSELFSLDSASFYKLIWQSPNIGYKMLSAMGKVMSGWLEASSTFLHDMVRWGENARKKAITDGLTGLFNRRFIEETSSAFFSRNIAHPLPAAAMMMDLDHFHSLNDQFGREGGDYIISVVGKEIGKVIPENCVASRLAGDEFSFFLPEMDQKSVFGIAEDIRNTICDTKIKIESENSSLEVSVTTSIGVAFSPIHAKDSPSLFSIADKALFLAKEAGRNRVQIAP